MNDYIEKENNMIPRKKYIFERSNSRCPFCRGKVENG
jgi:hypothetical protein